MFKRQNRLPGRIKLNDSRTFPTNIFVLKVRENGLVINRFGIIVSRKIDKRAVVRNKIKRMLRKILVDLSSEMIIGHDMLFITRSGIINNGIKVNSVVRQVLEKAECLR